MQPIQSDGPPPLNSCSGHPIRSSNSTSLEFGSPALTLEFHEEMAARCFNLCPYNLTGFRKTKNSPRGANEQLPPINSQYFPHKLSSKLSNGTTFVEVTHGAGAVPGKPKNARIYPVANYSNAPALVPPVFDVQAQWLASTSDIHCQKGDLLPYGPAQSASILDARELGSFVVMADSSSTFSSDGQLGPGPTLRKSESSTEVTSDADDDGIGACKGQSYAAEAPQLASSPFLTTSRSSPLQQPYFSTHPDQPTLLHSYSGDNTLFIPLPEDDYDLTVDNEEGSLADQQRSTDLPEASIFVQQMNQLDANAPYPFCPHASGLHPEGQGSDAYVVPLSDDRLLSTILKLRERQYDGDRHFGMDQINYPSNLHIRNGSMSDMSTCCGRSLSREPLTAKPPKRKWWEKKKPKQPQPSLPFLNLSSKSSFSSASSQYPTLLRSRSCEAVPSQSMAENEYAGELQIDVRIAETHSRQRYLLRLCKALMKYGAPTHRLEEYMCMTAKVLDVDGQFLYIPGCMVVSFDDATTHATDVKLVKAVQGVDLGRLFDVHKIYKEVIHDVIDVGEATERIESIMKQKPLFNVWILILVHGFASASVGPFAFGARPIDMPIAFILGCLLGTLQLVLSPRSYLYSNVFEISAAVLTSFLARAFGSIPYNGGRLFCFSALAQSSIALILPGYMVLCGSLELQSRSIVAGSVRMVYSIIYSLFLGFGITIGTSVYGLLDPNASSEYTCPASPIQNPYLQRLPFVLMFTFCLSTINQSKWKQMPVMLMISLCGYLTTYLSTKRLGYNTQVVNALGAFVIGVMGNLYSRLGHGLAAAAILPAIFVQVPSGLASSGSLVSGLTSADEISRNSSFYSIINNGTQGFLEAQQNISLYGSKAYSGVVFDIGFGMVQVAIGITVGLFLAALVVYPLGKKRSGLFSF
jgi:uncharacterized membrane protein YjjP (DUF1212 family)